MIGANIAPGLNRAFAAEKWKHLFAPKLWYDAIEEANDEMNPDISMDIQGYDIDDEIIRCAQTKCKGCRGGQTDSFSAASGQRNFTIRKNTALLLQTRRMVSALKKKRHFRSYIRKWARLSDAWTGGRTTY